MSRSRLARLILYSLALATAVPAASAQDRAPERASGWTPKAPVVTKRDMVVAANPIAVDAGVRMLQLAHQQYGKLPWAQLFEPAIAVAEHGFAVSPETYVSEQTSGLHVIMRTRNGWIGGADPRREGIARGE